MENHGFPCCLRLLITGTVVNHVQFLVQTDCFASSDLSILSGATGVDLVCLDMIVILKDGHPLSCIL